MLEINLGGVFIPAVLVWAGVAFVFSILMARVLALTGFYRLLWHRALFNFAIFVILWGGISGGAYYLAFCGT